MSTCWRIQFFSGLCARQGDREYTELGTRHGEALLACLLLRPDPPCMRKELYQMLWPEEDDDLILKNRFSTILTKLRLLFKDPDLFPHKSTPTVCVNLDAVETDVYDFKRLLAEAAKTEVLNERIHLLRTAIALYKGPLLPGNGAAWIVQWRDELALKHQEALCDLAQTLFAAGDFGAALEQAMQWLGAVPCDERAHRMLMEVYAELGRTPEAVRHFESFERLLAKEQKSPDLMTKELADRLRDRMSPPALVRPPSSIRSAIADDSLPAPAAPKNRLHPVRSLIVGLVLLCVVALGLTSWTTSYFSPLSRERQMSPHDQAGFLCQRGRTQWNQRTRDGMEAALGSFRKAAQLAPNYAPAYAGLADTYGLLGYYGWTSPAESFEQDIQNARKAVHWATDSRERAEAYTSLGWADMMNWQWDSAKGDFAKAITFAPKYSTAHQWYSLWLIIRGDKDESEIEIGEAEGDDPSSSVIPKSLGQRLYYSGKYTQAVQKCSEALINHPDDPLTTLWLGLAYEKLGQREKASFALNEAVRLSGHRDAAMLAALGHFRAASGDTDDALSLLHELQSRRAARNPDDYVSPVALALIDAGLFDKERSPQDKAAVLQQLETASHEHAGDLILMGIEPRFASLASAPRFHQIKQQIGL